MSDTEYEPGDLVDEVADIVAERAEQYGPPETNLNHVADVWSSYLGIDLDGWDYAALMVLAKLVRARDGSLDEDTAKDVAGYADAGWAAHLSDGSWNDE